MTDLNPNLKPEPSTLEKVLTSESTIDRPQVRVCREVDIMRKIKARNMFATDRSSNKVRA